jgi:hypothetical protein
MKKQLLWIGVAALVLVVVAIGGAFAVGRGLGHLLHRATNAGGSSTDGPSYFDDARPLAEAFRPVLGEKPPMCSLIIREHEAALTIQSGPEETAEQLLRQADGRPSANGHGFCSARPMRSLGDAAFSWSDVDLGVVPAMATEARVKLGLDASVSLSHLLLERAVLPPDGTPPAAGTPMLRSAAPRWKVIFSSSAAFAEFDLAGRFVGGMNASGWPVGAGGAVNYHEDASGVPKLIAEKLGPDFKLVLLMVFPGYVIFEGRPAGQPSGLARYNVRAGTLNGPDPAAMGFRPDLEQSFFLLSELDFSVVPKILADGRVRVGKPEAGAAQVTAEKKMSHHGLCWTVVLAVPSPPPLEYDLSGKPIGAGTDAAGGSDADAIQTSDLEHVDPLELLRQATAIALKLEPKAQFTGITTSGPLLHGTLDLRGEARVLYRYEYSFFDRSKPPGQDKVEGDVWVHASQGRFSGRRLDGSATTLKHLPVSAGSPSLLPRCPVKKAWAAAIQSGMPDDAVAQLLYEVSVGHGGAPVWRLRVDGHPELDRDVDSMTCKVVGRKTR